MPTQTIKKFSELRKRINHFFEYDAYSRHEVRNFINKIELLGEVVIFGGMLRDLSILGNESFKSDVDLVIDTNDIEKLENILSEFKYYKNKYDGYRINLGKWNVDLWTLGSTWAFREGLVKGVVLEDLCKTTFFNWDAIIYKIGAGEFCAIDGYIDRINERLLDINLEENVNYTGNVIKTFRYYEKYDAKLSAGLANYVYRLVSQKNYEDLYKAEKISHDWPLLEKRRISKIFDLLKEHQENSPLLPFEYESAQPQLWGEIANKHDL